MNFAITTWQQAAATGAFFFVGAFCWGLGGWCASKFVGWIGPKAK